MTSDFREKWLYGADLPPDRHGEALSKLNDEWAEIIPSFSAQERSLNLPPGSLDEILRSTDNHVRKWRELVQTMRKETKHG